MNVRIVTELMAKAGWTPKLFAEAINSQIRINRHTGKTLIDEISEEQAAVFLKTGGGLENAQYDLVERWVERRMCHDGVSNPMFEKPMLNHTLSMVRPEIIVNPEEMIHTDNAPIAYMDKTNQRAREKMLADRVRG